MQEQPYLVHNLQQVAQDVMFCPYEDVLGIGCENGFTSMLVPGKLAFKANKLSNFSTINHLLAT